MLRMRLRLSTEPGFVAIELLLRCRTVEAVIAVVEEEEVAAEEVVEIEEAAIGEVAIGVGMIAAEDAIDLAAEAANGAAEPRQELLRGRILADGLTPRNGTKTMKPPISLSSR
jgi:hypothetical protein